MSNFIHNVHILPKKNHQRAHDLSWEIRDWLGEKGVWAAIYNHEDYSDQFGKEEDTPDIIMVLGGDGTILNVVGKLQKREVPLLGFNFGHVGFLTELDPDHWKHDLEKVLQGEFSISERLVLKYKLIRDGEVIQKGSFINDLVVGRGSLARLVDLSLWTGEEPITEIRADGLIVSTPLGSTAYSVAAGGPLISPELDVLELCPVCPFLKDMRPVVLPSSSVITIRVETPYQGGFLTLDGQTGMDLESGDWIVIEKSSKQMQLIQLSKSSYVQKLKSKGYIDSGKH